MIIAGIDPGLAGAIAIINDLGIVAKIVDMPIKMVGKGRQAKKHVDLQGVRDILADNKVQAVALEHVNASPMQGASVAFVWGGSFRGVEGVVIGLGLDLKLVRPQRWKTKFGLLGKDKDAARLKAKKDFPALATYFKFKKNVDRADALYIGLSY